MMNPHQILAQYDRERSHAEVPGFRREEADGIVRSVGLAEPFGWVSYSKTDGSTADDAIEEQIRYFSALGYGFEWKWHAHDRPPDLRQRLIDHGFEPGEEETIVVLDLEKAMVDPVPDASRTIRRLRDADELRRALTAVHGRATEAGNEDLVAGLSLELEQTPERLGIYVALEADIPASIGWLRLPAPGFRFASLWGGTTAPAFRCRGHYSALVAARVRDARAHGARFLTVDALPASRPILEKLGFKALTTTIPMTWPPASIP